VLAHNQERQLVESVLLHDLDSSLGGLRDSLRQVRDFDANRVARHFLSRVNVKEKPAFEANAGLLARFTNGKAPF
jgi:hypothetical protein